MSTANQQYALYAVVDEPFCLWEDDVQAKALEFLDHIDPGYFEYLALQGQRSMQDVEHKKHAMAAMRIGFFHGAETLFLLIGALLQAVNAPHAFLAQCWPAQLRTLLKRIGSGTPIDLLCWKGALPSWALVGRIVCRGSHANLGQAENNAQLFASFWARLAAEYLDQAQIDEHNSLKHGFRVGHGGVRIAIGSPGVERLDDTQFTELGGSRDGTVFYRIMHAGGEEKGNQSRASRTVFVNWTPESVAIALQLISCSITNVVSMLKLHNGALPTEVKFRRFQSDAAFTRPWETSPRVRNFEMASEMSVGRVRTKTELVEEWHRLQSRVAPEAPNDAGDA